MNNPTAGLPQKASAALSGFGGGFSRSLLPMGQNMLLMGTVGTLGGLGAGRSMSGVNRAIELKMPGQTRQSIMGYRGEALTSELKLPVDEMKGIISKALGVGVHHEDIRQIDVQHHNDLEIFKSSLNKKMNDIQGRL